MNNDLNMYFSGLNSRFYEKCDLRAVFYFTIREFRKKKRNLEANLEMLSFWDFYLEIF